MFLNISSFYYFIFYLGNHFKFHFLILNIFLVNVYILLPLRFYLMVLVSVLFIFLLEKPCLYLPLFGQTNRLQFWSIVPWTI